jgi:hypothetical protein
MSYGSNAGIITTILLRHPLVCQVTPECINLPVSESNNSIDCLSTLIPQYKDKNKQQIPCI